MVRLTDRPDMTLDVYRGCKTTIQQQQKQSMVVSQWYMLLYQYVYGSKQGGHLNNSCGSQTCWMRDKGWSIVLGLTALLDSISIYIGPFLRERMKEKRNDSREKKIQTTPPEPTASAVGPCPTLIQINRAPRHWKFTQHHRTTRPPPRDKGEECQRSDM